MEWKDFWLLMGGGILGFIGSLLATHTAPTWKAIGLAGLFKAIDDVAEALTGRRDYFWAKHHSVGGG